MHIETFQKKVLAGIVVLLVLFGAAVLWPMIRDKNRITAEMESQLAELQETRGKTEGLSAVSADVKRIRNEMNTGQKKIPNQGEIAELLRDISAHVQGEHLNDPSINAHPSIPGASYVTLPIQIGFKGSPLSAFGFINKVENMSRLTQFNRLHLAQIDRAPGEKSGERTGDRVEAEIELSTFFYNNSQETAR